MQSFLALAPFRKSSEGRLRSPAAYSFSQVRMKVPSCPPSNTMPHPAQAPSVGGPKPCEST